MQSSRIWAGTAVVVGTLLLGGAAQALTAQQTCFLAERTAGGKVAAAKLKCYAKAAKAGASVDSACLQKADAKFDATITKVESDGPCGGDSGIIKFEYVYGLTNGVTAAVTAPPASCAAKKILAVTKAVPSLIKCYGGAFKKNVGTPPVCLQAAYDKLAASLTKAEADGVCGGDFTTLQSLIESFVAATVSFPLVDNGDGTITDPTTGLMWEKKSNDSSVHDVDNRYKWTSVPGGTAADGPAFTDFLATLNTPPCFAGYCDWRLPNQDGRITPFTGPLELETLRTCRYPDDKDIPYDSVCIPPSFNTACTPGCTVNSCSCTVADYTSYWSSTTVPDYPMFAGIVSFFNREGVSDAQKIAEFALRAVRP